ncbi:Nuclear actin-protein involved in chromatin remodeling [Cichlidogyrus casuarinus]|uniref:Nuclear actin-protein involved in chromatin remodeling n=1 Tax=Cichlidogyrus casuarinus TaxID=1844966 RepID=A0ABD2PYH7_9PLAT
MDYVFRDVTARLTEMEVAMDCEFWVPEVVLLHGGLSQLPGLSKRMESEIKQRMPFSIDDPNRKPTILLCNDPLLDAWKGAASWADSCIRFGKGFPAMTKAMFEEYGTDYFIEHPLSNIYYSK